MANRKCVGVGSSLRVTSFTLHIEPFFLILWKILIRFNISEIKISKQQHIFFIYSKTQSVGFQEAHSKCHPWTDMPKSHHAPSNCRGFSWVGEESVKLIICCARTHSPRFQEEATVGSLINMFFFHKWTNIWYMSSTSMFFIQSPRCPHCSTLKTSSVCVCAWVGSWVYLVYMHVVKCTPVSTAFTHHRSSLWLQGIWGPFRLFSLLSWWCR